jgi:hypothetical protein
MDLWSKGLGRLVLTIRLSERRGMGLDEEDLVMKGTMGKPTYWDWAVNLKDEDVVDFLRFLKRPAPIRFIVESADRWTMLRTALEGALLFALRSIRYMIFGVPASATAAPGAEGRPGENKSISQTTVEEKQ